MSRQSFWELVAVAFLLIFFLAFAMPAISYARADVRDDLRRTDIGIIKRALEQYNNQHNQYVPTQNKLVGCTDLSESTDWLPAMPHDVRESDTQQYRYCVTDIQNNQVTAYYVEAQLENYQADQTGFDEDEARKYNYRVLNENSRTLYRVCGGTEPQCGK